jgi:hypothetical protein
MAKRVFTIVLPQPLFVIVADKDSNTIYVGTQLD